MFFGFGRIRSFRYTAFPDNSCAGIIHVASIGCPFIIRCTICVNVEPVRVLKFGIAEKLSQVFHNFFVGSFYESIFFVTVWNDSSLSVLMRIMSWSHSSFDGISPSVMICSGTPKRPTQSSKPSLATISAAASGRHLALSIARIHQ